MREKKSDDELLLAKVADKQKICGSKNKVTYTDFLNQKEQVLISKTINFKNCFFYGVNDNADRKILVFYPEKFNEELARKMLDKILAVIRIELPNDLKGSYEHRNYLSAVIKIGVDRCKIGDILVDEDGADIIVFDVNKEFIKQSLIELTRFKKSKIDVIPLESIRLKKDSFEEFTIIVSSMRIDNVISEIAGCSRSKAEEYIISEKIFINYETVLKLSKMVSEGDVVTIRGKGKFIIDGLVRNTKNGKNVIKVRKYA